MPVAGNVPWIIAWATARYHRKHRLTLGRAPNTAALREALVTFKNKCRWRIQLRDAECMKHSVTVRFRTTPICTEVDPKIHTWTNGFCNAICNVDSACRHQFRKWRRDCQESLQLLHLARRTLRNSGKALLVCDKETGLALLEAWEYDHEVERQLVDPWLQPSALVKRTMTL